jgi:hypothetical protein
MGEKTRDTIKDRIDLSRKRIEALKTKGSDIAQLNIIFIKIETAFKSGNVKEENLSEAVKKLENLLQVTEKVRGKPSEGKRKDKGGSPKAASKVFDFEAEMGSLSVLTEEIKGLGGDLSPIFHHLEALKKAVNGKDEKVFISYRDTVKPWLHEYIFSLKKAKVASLQESITSKVKELETWGREDLARPIKQEMSVLDPLIVKSGGDIDILISDLNATTGQSEKARSDLLADLKVRVDSSQRELRSLLESKEPKFDKSPFRETLIQTTQMSDEGEYAKALGALAERIDEVKRIVYREKVGTMDRFLNLLDPIIAKVGESSGPQSEAFLKLKQKRDQIKNLPIGRIDEGLKDIELLLDQAAKASAEAEESAMKVLQQRIETMVKETSSIQTPETQSMTKATQKAHEMLDEGDLAGAAKLMEKAEAFYRMVMQKKDRIDLERQFKAAPGRLKEKMSKGHDVKSLEETLAKAQELLMRNSIDASREQLAIVLKGLDLLDGSDDLADFQSIRLEVASEIDKLKAAGEDTKEKEARVSESIERSKVDLKSALASLRSISANNKAGETARILRERMAEIEGLVREARAFGLDVSGIENSLGPAKKALDASEIDRAMDIVTKAQVDIEALIKERSVKQLENEIEIIAAEMRRLNLITGDYRSKIASAYALVEQDKIEEAVSGLTGLKNELERKLSGKRILSMMDSMAARIREARMHNIEISGYKADLTKARVRYEAGDTDGALRDLIQSLKGLEDAIDKKKVMRGKMDQVRGSLISIEGKIGRLGARGIATSDYLARVAKLKGLIEAGDESGAREVSERLDADITNAFRDLPVVSISEGITTHARTAPEKFVRPSIEIAKVSKHEPSKAEELDPNEARRRLQTLLTRIGRAVQMGGSKAQEECKLDLERIKQLIVKRDYNAAYRIALDCMNRLGG